MATIARAVCEGISAAWFGGSEEGLGSAGRASPGVNSSAPVTGQSRARRPPRLTEMWGGAMLPCELRLPGLTLAAGH